MQSSIRNKGILGETIACTYLTGKGYTIVERNFQNTKGYKYGEIDIIARYENTLVFVEVKTRLSKDSELILPEENISPKKLRHMEKIASTYIRIKKLQDIPYHFDAISVIFDPQSKIAKVRHLEHIFF